MLPQPDSNGWVSFRATQRALCPAPRRFFDGNGTAHETCDRFLDDIGGGLTYRVRVHPDGPTGRPGYGSTCRKCKTCGTMLEFAQERRAEDRDSVRPAA